MFQESHCPKLESVAHVLRTIMPRIGKSSICKSSIVLFMQLFKHQVTKAVAAGKIPNYLALAMCIFYV